MKPRQNPGLGIDAAGNIVVQESVPMNKRNEVLGTCGVEMNSSSGLPAQTLSSVAFLLPPASSRVCLTRRHDHGTADIIHADDRYKVLKDRERIRMPRSTGKTLPVEFGTKEAAEGHVRAYQIMTRVRRWSRA